MPSHSIYSINQADWDSFSQSISKVLGVPYHQTEAPTIIHETDNNFSRKGYPHTEESKRLMSENSKGQIPWNKNKKLPPLSDDHKRKVSESLSGRTPWNKGIPITEEAREKCRKGSLENNVFYDPVTAAAAKEKISKKLKGRIFTPEWKKKLSDAAKARAQKKKIRQP